MLVNANNLRIYIFQKCVNPKMTHLQNTHLCCMPPAVCVAVLQLPTCIMEQYLATPAELSSGVASLSRDGASLEVVVVPSRRRTEQAARSVAIIAA